MFGFFRAFSGESVCIEEGLPTEPEGKGDAGFIETQVPVRNPWLRKASGI
jgi:hypothetical protein